MSGPKVVRVVTREELVAAGESQLRRLDAALSDWERLCVTLDVGADERKAFRERREALEQTLRADRFVEFDQTVKAEIEFVNANALARLERAAQARAHARARVHNGRKLAEALLRETRPSTELWAELQRAAAGELCLKDLDAVLALAQRMPIQTATRQLGLDEEALAVRLAGGENDENFEAWRLRAISAVELRLETLFKQISELELLGQTTRASELHQEILTAVAMPDDAVRNMRLDSLAIIVQRAQEEALAYERLRGKATFLVEELGHYGEAAEALRAMSVASNVATAEFEAAVAAGEKRLTHLQEARVAASRRKAVLDGLEQLGYSVHEELSTVTAKGGRLVVRMPASTNYGVEIVAGAELERFQVRAVVLDANRDSTEDIPAEERWCDDFKALKEALTTQGAKVIVERATGVGAVPLKLLSHAAEGEGGRTSSAPSQVAKK